jgi:hypothetical protein
VNPEGPGTGPVVSELSPGRAQVAAVLAEAREEALEERPLACAALNSVIDRLAEVWAADPEFDAASFRLAANYRGMSDGRPDE